MKNEQQTKKLNLYKKEQLTILLLLLCFALSAFLIPERTLTEPVSSKIVPNTSDVSEEIPENNKESSNPDDSEIADNSDESIENSDEIAGEGSENNEEFTNKGSSNSKDNSNDGSSSKKEPSTGSSKKPAKDKPKKEPEKEPAKEPEKVWVPPVYEIVHHDAVYKTVRIVVCNYCSENFDSVGAFQVHKDANGG